MTKVLKTSEITDKTTGFAEQYSVRFWAKDGEYWRQKTEYYHTTRKGKQKHVLARWRRDYKAQNVVLIQLNYM